MGIFFKSDRISINSAKDGVETLELSNGKLNHNRTFFLMEDTYSKLCDEKENTCEVLSNNHESIKDLILDFKHAGEVNLEILENFILKINNILNTE